MRTHIENIDQSAETFGCPGFFGVEFYFQAENAKFYDKLCPAPVTPKYLIKEYGVSETRKHDLFYTNKINSKIIKIKWHWSGKANRYITEEGIPITLYHYYYKELMIGDSVSKGNNTYSFQVFRLNSLASNYYLVELKK